MIKHAIKDIASPWSPDGSDWVFGSNGIGWRIWVPLEQNENYQIHSFDQTAPRRTLGPTGESFVWDKLTGDSGEELEIRVEMTLEVAGSSLISRLTIDNQSDRVVESALFPLVHGIHIPSGRALKAMTRDYFGAKTHSLWPVFNWTKPYYGTERPTIMTESLVFGNPTAPFVVMADELESVSVFVHGPDSAITSWMWELTPGYSDSLGDKVPSVSSGLDPQLVFSAVHLLGIHRNESRELLPIEFSHSLGSWQKSLQPYRDRRMSMRGSLGARDGNWSHEPRNWFQVQLNSPVGDRSFSFADMPSMAEECLANGVDVLHVIGWNEGGQDRNNPCHKPDSALGGMIGLQKAIAECQDIGVRVVLFSKFTWADESSHWFRKDLHKSAIRNPYGDYYVNPGYAYLTPHQLLGVNTRRLIPMCFLDEAFLQVCDAEFDTILETGADGMLFDEAMHHTPALLCYDVSHGHSAGVSAYAGDLDLIARLRSRVPSNRDFVIAGETVYEDLQPSYDASYIRSHYEDHVPMTRFVNPWHRMMTTVSGFDDRNQINQALAYGYTLCFEPFHFKGKLSDVPLTVSYSHVAEALRKELRRFLWDGEYLGDAVVHVDPGVAHASGVWEAASGDRVTLIANYDAQVSLRVTVDGQWTHGRLVETAWAPLDAIVSVPPRSLLVLK
jgi:hypothetical protein